MMKHGSIILVALVCWANGIAAQPPDFQAPYQCGQVWRASTYEGHKSDAIDMVQRDTNLAIIGEFEPVLASAAGEVVFDYTWPSGSKEGERWVIIDHKNGWRTHYFHLEEESDRPRLSIGRKVALGEVIGRTSNSGANAVHLHYAQMDNVSRDAEDLNIQATDGKWKPVLSDGDKHRVIFDGTAIDTYYANQDSWGHFSSDESEKIISYNCLAGQFVQWFDNGRIMMLRYNPGNGDTRINEIHPTGGNNPLLYSSTWEKTWNTILPFYSATNGQAHLLRYDFASGDMDFFRVSIGGTGLTPTASVNIYGGWTEIVPIRLGGKPHAVFYDSRYGWFNVIEINADGSGFTDRLKTKIKTSYTHLVPYEEGPRRYVLMYMGSTGRFKIQELTKASNGSVQREVVWSAKRRAGWTHLSLLLHKGQRYVLGYNSVTGNSKIWNIKSNGGGLTSVEELDWKPGWTAITPYRDEGSAHVLLYRASDGISRKIKMKANATGFSHQITEDWANGYI